MDKSIGVDMEKCKFCGTDFDVIGEICGDCYEDPSSYEELQLPFDDPRFEGSCAGGACDTGK